jgi:hypothetical protein
MPTPTEISKDWQTHRTYVVKCIKKGCPTDSFENARDWRKANTTKRATTSPVQIAKKLAEESEETGKYRVGGQKSEIPHKKKTDAVQTPPPDSLDDALAKAIGASNEAFRLLSESMIEEKDSKISSRLSIHNKALDARFRAEQSHREELERRQILIPLAEAKEWARKAFGIILSRLAALPQNMAVRCNPTNPHIAMVALETERDIIISDAQKAISV